MRFRRPQPVLCSVPFAKWLKVRCVVGCDRPLSKVNVLASRMARAPRFSSAQRQVFKVNTGSTSMVLWIWPAVDRHQAPGLCSNFVYSRRYHQVTKFHILCALGASVLPLCWAFGCPCVRAQHNAPWMFWFETHEDEDGAGDGGDARWLTWIVRAISWLFGFRFGVLIVTFCNRPRHGPRARYCLHHYGLWRGPPPAYRLFCAFRLLYTLEWMFLWSAERYMAPIKTRQLRCERNPCDVYILCIVLLFYIYINGKREVCIVYGMRLYIIFIKICCVYYIYMGNDGRSTAKASSFKPSVDTHHYVNIVKCGFRFWKTARSCLAGLDMTYYVKV